MLMSTHSRLLSGTGHVALLSTVIVIIAVFHPSERGVATAAHSAAEADLFLASFIVEHCGSLSLDACSRSAICYVCTATSTLPPLRSPGASASISSPPPLAAKCIPTTASCSRCADIQTASRSCPADRGCKECIQSNGASVGPSSLTCVDAHYSSCVSCQSFHDMISCASMNDFCAWSEATGCAAASTVTCHSRVPGDCGAGCKLCGSLGGLERSQCIPVDSTCADCAAFDEPLSCFRTPGCTFCPTDRKCRSTLLGGYCPNCEDFSGNVSRCVAGPATAGCRWCPDKSLCQPAELQCQQFFVPIIVPATNSPSSIINDVTGSGSTSSGDGSSSQASAATERSKRTWRGVVIALVVVGAVVTLATGFALAKRYALHAKDAVRASRNLAGASTKNPAGPHVASSCGATEATGLLSAAGPAGGGGGSIQRDSTASSSGGFPPAVDSLYDSHTRITAVDTLTSPATATAPIPVMWSTPSGASAIQMASFLAGAAAEVKR